MYSWARVRMIDRQALGFDQEPVEPDDFNAAFVSGTPYGFAPLRGNLCGRMSQRVRRDFHPVIADFGSILEDLLDGPSLEPFIADGDLHPIFSSHRFSIAASLSRCVPLRCSGRGPFRKRLNPIGCPFRKRAATFLLTQGRPIVSD